MCTICFDFSFRYADPLLLKEGGVWGCGLVYSGPKKGPMMLDLVNTVKGFMNVGYYKWQQNESWFEEKCSQLLDQKEQAT
jgi:hypothetical protein